ncbi:MAG: LacI family DNA-binding transcriptional regulator [Planctomycetota bacterium]
MNLAELAKLANASPTTVSKALSGTGRVAPDTRRRIAAIAERVGYRPTAAAKALATGKAQVIGLVSTRGFRTYLGGIIQQGLVDYLEKRHYHLMVFHAEPGQGNVPPWVLRRMVDGIVLQQFWTPSFVAELARQNIPALIALPADETHGIPSVSCDDVDGAKQATQHLIHLGHRRIAFYQGCGNPLVRNHQLHRWCGYVSAMGEAGFPVFPGGDLTDVNSEKILYGLFIAPQRRETDRPAPTALVCFSDLNALEAMGWLRRHGLDVPRDVSLIGFDHDYYGKYLEPALTTMAQPFADMGAEAGRLLVGLIEGEDLPVQDIVMLQNLVIRGSTASPAGSRLLASCERGTTS